MKTCPKCGYARQAMDDEFTNAPPNACPKCFSFYDNGADSDPNKTDSEITASVAVRSPQSAKPSSKNTFLIIAVTAVVAVLATLYYSSPKKTSPTEENTLQAVQRINTHDSMPSNELSDQPLTIAEITEIISSSVVSVIVYNRNREPVGRASGFFINNSGNVITNYHVVKGSGSYEIKTAQGNVFPVNSIVAEDRTNDLVMLSTGASHADIKPIHISTVPPQVGDKVIVIGNPFGLEQTVSDGIVSALREYNDARKVIQITAPISPGSSGSPVVNMKGEVIGVAFMHVIGGQNLNFCIPVGYISKLDSGPAYSLSEFTAQSSDKFYCYLDEGKKVRLIKNPEKVAPNYVLLTQSDGTPDRERFEKWIFELLTHNPYKIDPQAEVEAEKDRLPEHFRRIFPGYEMEQLGRFSPEARAFWGSWVANHMQKTYDQASRSKQEGIRYHKALMESFDQYTKH